MTAPEPEPEAEPEGEPEAEAEPEAEPADGGPLFLFPYPGFMVGSCVEASSTALGALYVALALVTVVLLPVLAHGPYVRRVPLCLLGAAAYF